MSTDTIHRAVANLARIEYAGLLPDLQAAAFDATRDWPAGDTACCTPGQQIAVDELADLARRILHVNANVALDAAKAACVRSRQSVALELIEEYARRLDGTTKATAAPNCEPAAITRARQRAKH